MTDVDVEAARGHADLAGTRLTCPLPVRLLQ